jgi:hypothetical protein
MELAIILATLNNFPIGAFAPHYTAQISKTHCCSDFFSTFSFQTNGLMLRRLEVFKEVVCSFPPVTQA